MRLASRALLLAALVLVPSLAAAQSPVQLAWRACSGVATSVTVETFPCNTNTAPGGDPIQFRLVGSFTPGYDQADFKSLTAIVDVATPDAVLPNWWGLGAGECREGSLTAGVAYGALGLCANPFAPGSLMAVNLTWVTGFSSPGRARLYVDAVAADPSPIVAGVRYTAFELRLDAAHAIDDGDPSCAGCCTPACILLSEVRLSGAGGSGEYLFSGGPEALVGWNGQPQYSTPGGCFIVGGCPTPSGARTWGAIKSLYR